MNIKLCWCEVVDGAESADVHTDSKTNVLSIRRSSDCRYDGFSVSRESRHLVDEFKFSTLGTMKFIIKENSSYLLNAFITGPDGLLSSSLAYSNMINNNHIIPLSN